MSIDLNSTAILSIDGIDYNCIIDEITKKEAINSLRNADLNEKGGLLHKFSLSYIKNV